MRPYDEPEATAYGEETVFIAMAAIGWLVLIAVVVGVVIWAIIG